MKKFKLFILFTAALTLFCSCGKKYADDNFFAMDTYVYVTAMGADKNMLATAENAVSEIEDLMSKTKSGSEIYLLNENGKAILSEKTLYILEKSVNIANETNEAFSPTLGNLTALWNITAKNPRVPSDEEIKEALSKCNLNALELGENAILSNGVKLDLGGIAKGYAAECAINALKAEGLENAMISIGGNVAVIGSSERNLKKNKSGWNVGIKNPKNPDEILGYIEMNKGICAVSGDYERYFIENGKKYHHIFDVKSGYPARSGLASVAVISDDGALADALTTAFFVMGEEKAKELYKRHIFDFEAIFIDEENNVTTTENIKFYR